MGFETKRALLEHLGKNPNDNKLIDRMMMRWEVYKEDWMYFIVENDEVTRLKEEVAELREKLKQWWWEEAKLKEMRRHLSYVWKLNEDKRACIEKIADNYYKKHQDTYDYDSAMKRFYGAVWFIEDSWEKDEKQWAIDNNIISL